MARAFVYSPQPPERIEPIEPPELVQPRIELAQTFWRMAAPSGRHITCALYRTAEGLELRAGEGEGDHLLWNRVQTPHAAEVIAAMWKTAAAAQGFSDLDVPAAEPVSHV